MTASRGPDQATGDRPTVLVVDDDAGVRRLAVMMLTRSGYEVLEAGNGREALEMFAAHPDEVDVVLLDITMPIMSGKEAFVELRNEDPSLPIVFFSGYDQSEVAEYLAAPSAPTLFLPKPFSRSQLTDHLEAVLAGPPQQVSDDRPG